MNRSYSAGVVPDRGCRSCRSRRRGCGRQLPFCPNCRRQTTSTTAPYHHHQDVSWHRGNDGRLVARGHQRGILSIRSRKLDTVVKRQGETQRKRNRFVLSLPRGLSLARLARGDLSPWTKKALINITPLDSEMTDLYELLVNMSLCEDDVEFLPPSFQRDATPPPCMEIDMEDLEELPCPPQEEEDSDSKPTASTETDEELSKTTTEESPKIKEEDEEKVVVDEEKEEFLPSKTADVEKSSLETILDPLHQETPIPEAELAAILDSLLRHKSPEPCQKETDFPSVDRFLQIMEVISQLTGTVMKPTSDSRDDSARITSLTPQHLAVIMNLRSLLDYATKVLCIKSIETPSIKDTAMKGGMELVV